LRIFLRKKRSLQNADSCPIRYLNRIFKEHEGVVKLKLFTDKLGFGECMTRLSELGYLFEIELLDKGIISEPLAILGSDMVGILRKDAHAYIEWMGDKRFDKYLYLELSGTWNAKSDPEAIAFLKEDKEKYIRLVCDSNLDPHNPETYFPARYWMWNGDKKGWPFRTGIEEKDILFFNEGYPLRKISNLSEVENDDDLWGFVNTWLERNWRKRTILSH
jgi:hypothetical protein